MLKSYNPKRKETLAEYYYRTNKHLLGVIIIAEYEGNKLIGVKLETASENGDLRKNS